MKIFNWQNFNESKKETHDTIKKIRYYHVSGTRYRVGQMIGGPGRKVFLNTSPIVHSTIWSAVLGGFSSWKEYQDINKVELKKYWDERMEFNKGEMESEPKYPKTINKKNIPICVYEVKPEKKPYYVGANEEYVAENNFCEVIAITGNAKGILQNHIKKFGITKKAYLFGARAIKSSHSKRTSHFNNYEGDKAKPKNKGRRK